MINVVIRTTNGCTDRELLPCSIKETDVTVTSHILFLQLYIGQRLG